MMQAAVRGACEGSTGCGVDTPDVLAVTAAIEQDVGQEIEDKYGNVVDGAPEFAQYQTAVRDLQAALHQGDEASILNGQDAVAEAARELSELVVQSPIAGCVELIVAACQPLAFGE